MWKGAAAVCLNEEARLLMVLQGKPEEEKRWSVPSGGMEEGETFETCCSREVWEETGYRVEVGERIHEKCGQIGGASYTVRYFTCRVIGGSRTIQDPDGLIHDIAWISEDELHELPLCFPEDLPLFLRAFADRRAAFKDRC